MVGLGGVRWGWVGMGGVGWGWGRDGGVGWQKGERTVSEFSSMERNFLSNLLL